jgi:hypothetical protein
MGRMVRTPDVGWRRERDVLEHNKCVNFRGGVGMQLTPGAIITNHQTCYETIVTKPKGGRPRLGAKPMTPAERMRRMRERKREGLRNAEPVTKPGPAEAKSWWVEFMTEDGKRWINGARFETKAEAALYAHMGICDLATPDRHPLWGTDREAQVVVMTRVLPSDDEPNTSLRYPEYQGEEELPWKKRQHTNEKRKRHRKAGQLRHRLAFEEGSCHLFNWHPG